MTGNHETKVGKTDHCEIYEDNNQDKATNFFW